MKFDILTDDDMNSFFYMTEALIFCIRKDITVCDALFKLPEPCPTKTAFDIFVIVFQKKAD